MKSEWTKTTAGFLIQSGVLQVGDGYRAQNSELGSQGFPFARAGNIDGGFDFSGADRFPSNNIRQVGEKVSRPGDVVFTSKGTVGRMAFVNDATEPFVYSPQLCYWRALDLEKIWPHFLFYWMQSQEFLHQIGYMKGQTDMADYVSLRDQKCIEISLPPLSEQRAIARILSSLDDKIELNRRMNATLEAMAQTLFRAWFVDFEPVKAKAAGLAPVGLDAETAALFPSEFEESELGPIPQGWEVSTLKSAYQIFDSRRIPLSGKERDLRRGIYPYYGAASVMDYIDGFLFDGIYVLIGEDGSVLDKEGYPVIQYAWGKFWVNNHAHVLQGKAPISTEHLMLALKNQKIVGFVTGAVQPKLTQANLARIPLVVPSEAVASAFGEKIKSFYTRIRLNEEESRTLAQVRDSLLPRLISGQLRVTA